MRLKKATNSIVQEFISGGMGETAGSEMQDA